MKWFSLHCHSYYSMLDSAQSPGQIAERCAEVGIEGSALTDHGTISGAVDFVKAMNKAKLKWILGCEFYLCDGPASVKSKENRSLSHLCVLAKNQEGWRQLVQAVSLSNDSSHFYHRPRLQLAELGQFAGDLIAFSGHVGSDLANILFLDYRAAYRARSKEEVLAQVDPDVTTKLDAAIRSYQSIFGEQHFFVEIQAIDRENMPAVDIIVNLLREGAKRCGVPTVATADSHYSRHEDAFDQRVVLCVSLETSLRKVKTALANNEDVALGGFFRSQNYHIPSQDEIGCVNTPEEIAGAAAIADMCETYEILSEPRIPGFKCPDGQKEIDYLRVLAREGWKKKIIPFIPKDQHALYGERVREELEIIEEGNLAGYLLIVHDMIKEFRGRGCLMGAGRGSIGGLLIAYLLDLTSVNAVENGLLVSRFYNRARKGALPDIDTDFPKYAGDEVIRYLKAKYGDDCVAQISTFGSMKGRGALKDVFRVHEACDFEEMNRITECVPDEAKIADQLQELQDEGENATIIDWALDNHADKLKEWCWRDENGRLQGKFAKLFEQAIRLEGVKRNRGKHAAGVIISPEPLNKLCPMVFDKETGESVCGLDFKALEAMGLVKIDVLRVAFLDKLMGINRLLEGKSLSDVRFITDAPGREPEMSIV